MFDRCAIVRPPAQLRAFTVLELLIVTGIVGLLLGLLLPALMAAGESARCLQCASNLREIGLAMQHYHDAAKRLPAAWRSAGDGVSGYGWAVTLLPFLEEQALEQSVCSRLPIAAAENARPRNADVSILHCPSDISEPTFDLYVEPHNPAGGDAGRGSSKAAGQDGSPLVRLPAANYVGVYGTIEADETVPAPAGDGPIIAQRAVRYADLERGSSHTLIVGERTTAMVPTTWLGVDFRGEDAACRLVGSAITSPSCEPCDECEFGSRHPGGSNFAWADGHVSLVSSDIDPREYQRLAQRRRE